ncbi:MAG: PEGA domain-containing protein [Anaerolineales bacterium]|nr:PEGA domain-containing protein [Anaerolineales bacterium]
MKKHINPIMGILILVASISACNPNFEVTPSSDEMTIFPSVATPPQISTAEYTDSGIESYGTPTKDVTITQNSPISPTITKQILSENISTSTSESFVNVTISSVPSGAEVTIVGNEATGITPFTTTLATGNHTIILKKSGYHSIEVVISLSDLGNTNILEYLIPYDMTIDHYIKLTDLGGVGDASQLSFLAEVDWVSEDEVFLYALNEGSNLSEAKDWSWEKYDLTNQEIGPQTSPTSAINDETRRNLKLCPLDKGEWESSIECEELTAVFESKEHGFVVYSPLSPEDTSSDEGGLWIARLDGSNARKLSDFEPAYVNWSSDGQWFVTGERFAGLPGQAIHYLARTDGTFFKSLQNITGIDSFYVNGLFPQFSPDGQMLLYPGTKIIESLNAEDYGLFKLDLNTLEHDLITDRFGLFQWASDGRGVYVLDEAFTPFDVSLLRTAREASLYFIDIVHVNLSQEYSIASNIPYYPHTFYGSWNWAYSPTSHAIAYVGYKENNELGVLSLSLFTEEAGE